jgi:hypothetical protein
MNRNNTIVILKHEIHAFPEECQFFQTLDMIEIGRVGKSCNLKGICKRFNRNCNANIILLDSNIKLVMGMIEDPNLALLNLQHYDEVIRQTSILIMEGCDVIRLDK